MPTETKPTAVPLTKSDQVVALEEARAFMQAHPNYYACRENMVILDHYLKMHNLAPTYPNFKQAYEELTETGQLHLSAPDPQQPGPPIYGKVKIEKFSGSHYDRTEILKLKREIALMTSEQLREFMQVNGWDDFPAWLRG